MIPLGKTNITSKVEIMVAIRRAALLLLVSLICLVEKAALAASFVVREPLSITIKKSRSLGLTVCQEQTLDDQYVWFYDDRRDDQTDDDDDVGWRRRTTARHQKRDDHTTMLSIHETWRWCQGFVIPLNLCPWAAASVTSPGAMQFYVVPNDDNRNNDDTTQPATSATAPSARVTPARLEAIVHSVAERFVEMIASSQQTTAKNNRHIIDMTKVAIAFVVIQDDDDGNDDDNANHHWYHSFPEFYQWFIDLEDFWIDQGEQLTTPSRSIP